MAICPFAVQQLIPESWQQGSIRPTTVILHRAVSSAKSLQNYWNSPGVELESHFYVGEDGTIYQFVDTEVRADANMSANGFAVSIETWDGGNTPDSMEWNPAQVGALKRLVAWVCDEHGIAKRAAATWAGGGIGGHNWFPTEWAGGPRGCPGTARNVQIRNDIIPAVAAGRLEDDLDMDEATFRSWVRLGNADWIKKDLAPGSDQRALFQKLVAETEVEVRPDTGTPWKDQLGSVLAAIDRRLVRVEDKPSATVAMTQADREAIAKLAREGLAEEIADKLAKRLES